MLYSKILPLLYNWTPEGHLHIIFDALLWEANKLDKLNLKIFPHQLIECHILICSIAKRWKIGSV